MKRLIGVALVLSLLGCGGVDLTRSASGPLHPYKGVWVTRIRQSPAGLVVDDEGAAVLNVDRSSYACQVSRSGLVKGQVTGSFGPVVNQEFTFSLNIEGVVETGVFGKQIGN